jgi:hypothetical protein
METEMASYIFLLVKYVNVSLVAGQCYRYYKVSYNVNSSGVQVSDAALGDADSICSHSQMTLMPVTHVQTISTPVMAKKRKLDPTFSNVSETMASSTETVEPTDNSYCIEDDYSSDQMSSQGLCSQQQVPLHEEEKYIVFKSCLWRLFSECPVCTAPCAVTEHCKGTLLVVNQKCCNSRCRYLRRWDSQPFVANIPAGNILLSAAILFSGASQRKTLKLLASFGLVSISESTYLQHARSYLQPTIYKLW